MKLRNIAAFASLFLLLLVIGCGGAEQPAEETAATEAAPAAEPIDPATAATISGKVSFEGTAPRRRRIRMDAEVACAQMHSGPVYSEAFVLNDNGTLRNAFVYVKSGLEGRSFPAPPDAVVLDQKGCIYTPHVVGAMTGQTIRILNSDQTTHNVHPVPKNNREWNRSQAPGANAIEDTFARDEIMIPVKCNVHPWMKSYIGVLKHPYFAVTGADGTFEIGNLPPGDYTLGVWHESLGSTEMQVSVAAQESKTVDFVLEKAG